MEYGCGGKGLLSIYNLSLAYSPDTSLPVSESNYDGGACSDGLLPVVIDTYIAPKELNALEYGQVLDAGCDVNTTDKRCVLKSSSGNFELELGADGKFTIKDRNGDQKCINSRYSYYSAISDRTHWPLGPTTTKYTYSWASSYVRNLWQSYTSGKGTGQAKAVLDYYGGLMVVNAIGKVLYTSCDSYYSTCEPGHLAVDDFVTGADAGSGGPSSGPWPSTPGTPTTLLSSAPPSAEVIAGRRGRIGHTSELVALDRDICFFPGSWRIDGTVAPANPDMQGCQRVYRQEGCLSPGEHSLTMCAWGTEYGGWHNGACRAFALATRWLQFGAATPPRAPHAPPMRLPRHTCSIPSAQATLRFTNRAGTRTCTMRCAAGGMATA